MKKTLRLLLTALLLLAVVLCLHSCQGKTEYKITYVLYGGENSAKNPTSYKNSDVILSSPEKPAFEFLGWYEDEGMTNPISVIEKSTKSDVTVYAKWGSPSIDALIYSPNGAFGYGLMESLSRGEVTRISKNPFSKNGYKFVGWSSSPSGEVVYCAGDEYTMTDTSARVLYAVWEEIPDADKSFTPITETDYEKYYVQDGLRLCVDFYGVSEERNVANPLIGGDSYANVSTLASVRFTASEENYLPFIKLQSENLTIIGGTAQIASPWSFQNWYADYTVKMGTGITSDMRLSLPTENVASTEVLGAKHTVSYIDGTVQTFTEKIEQGKTIYYTDTLVDNVTDYYISDGKWSKKVYSSKWGEDCITLGINSSIVLSGLQSYLNTGIEDYTVQAVTSFDSANASGTVYMLGMGRFSVGAVKKNGESYLSFRSMTRSYNGSGSSAANFSPVTTDEKWYGINGNTFTFDRDYTGSTGKGTTSYGIYVNCRPYASVKYESSGLDGTIKIGEGQNTKLYAVRIYSRVITENEIKQNHFVDVAALYSLNLAGYSTASEDKRAEIHEHFASVSLSGENPVQLQAKLDSFFEAASADGVHHVIFNSGISDLGVICENYVIDGSSLKLPDITLAGSELLGWSDEENGEVKYSASAPIKTEGDMVLWAVWSHEKKSISYDTMGGTLPTGESAPMQYTPNADMPELPTPVKDGYIFCAWYTDKEMKKPISQISYNTHGDLSLYAGWVKDTDALFEINLTDEQNDISDKYGHDFSVNQNVMDRFMITKAELPVEITPLKPFDVCSYLMSNKIQLYVSPDGDDEDDGSFSRPFATVQRALSAAKGTGGAVIWIRGGEYPLSAPISINSTHSGTPTSPLIISAYGDEKPVFSTAKTLSPDLFKPIDAQNDHKASLISENHRANVVCVNLRELGWSDEEMGELTRDSQPKLLIDGERCEIARYPNKGEELLYIERVLDTGGLTSRDGSVLYTRWSLRVQNWKKWSDSNGGDYDWKVSFYNPSTYQTEMLYQNKIKADIDALEIQKSVDAGARVYTDSYENLNIEHDWKIGMIDLTPCSWENDGNIWYYGNLFSGWEHGYYNIREFNLAEKSMTGIGGSVYGAMVSSNSPTGHNDYFLFNAIEALDSAGEWYLDYETGVLYIYKTENFEKAKITYTATKPVNAITATYADNVIINGLTVDVASGYGIYAAYCEGLVVQNCHVSNTVNHGILLASTKKSAVIYNDVSRTNGTMISISGGASARSFTPELNVVQNNRCHTTLESKQNGISVSGCRNIVSHNYLEYCNITLSTSAECIVEYNELHGGSKYISDGGMIYLNGYYNLGNHIRYNYMHDWGTSGNGVYFDDLSSFNYAYYNIIDSSTKQHSKATGFLYTSSGHANVFFGNLLIGRTIDRINQSALYLNEKASLGYRWAGLSASFVKSYSSNYDQEAMHRRFPEVFVYLKKMSTHVEERAKDGYVRNELEIYLRSPANNIVANNVVLGTSVVFNQPALKETDGTVRPSTDYVENNFHFKLYDGFFVDMENGDFTLADGIEQEIRNTIPDFVPLSAQRCGIVE